MAKMMLKRSVAVVMCLDESELQSYFIKRIARFLETNDRKLVGWDKILEGG
ncbi:hypothetical protein MUB18_06265 [Sphingobacterium sp. PCS056]|uniref:hypothetical protein n=1 Tax=Sphingobacterium sp. PCS056 TaxID=2931400 RepID=UPI00200D5EA7|nr:hypothetical protein [Sphingobacterium sp. PCS056]UPZ37900.1 hypothetical protein MUB18_06265 [Sphingobacterium sp. PCS056]